jgi:predicted GH43/DUF377 family glycosyl hydrolase
MLQRYERNPILKPLHDHLWESKRVFNCAAVYEKGKVHLVYRAQGEDEVSRFGYACSSDGYHIDERFDSPIFSPAHHFESFGCEDPRITRIRGDYYVCYTAYGKSRRYHRADKTRLAQVGITSIRVNDFLDHRWNWRKRVYPLPLVDSKNCVLFSKRFGGKYAIYHRIPPHIWVGYSDKLEDWSNSYHRIVMQPQETWERTKMGAAAPPIETDRGWLLLYHAIDPHFTYRLGVALIDSKNPEKVTRAPTPILEPREDYERNIVFSCGAVVLDGILLVYYGADDRTICVATCSIPDVLSAFERHAELEAHRTGDPYCR